MRNPFFISTFSLLSALCLAPVAQAQVFVKELPPPAPTPVLSSKLRARLKAQVVLLAPKLRELRHSAADDDELALPMAILGDWKMAQQLATLPATFGALYQWRAQQLALAGKAAEARQSAARIKNSPLRADTLLVLARQDVEKGRKAEARTDLEQAAIAIQLRPNSSQMGYLGYLWSCMGDKEAARKTFDSAWPVAQQEAKRNQDKFGIDFESAPAPTTHTAISYSQEEFFQLAFLMESGMIDEALAHYDAKRAFPWSLLGTTTKSRWGRQHIREWLYAHPDATADAWNSLALAEAVLGDKQQARSDREQARTLRSAPATDPFSPLTLNFLLVRALDDEPTRQQAETNFVAQWNSRYPQDKTIPTVMLLFYRLVNLRTNGELEINPLLTQAELDAASTQILAFPPSSTKEMLFDILATAYTARKQNALLAKTGRTLASEAHKRTLTLMQKQANQIISIQPFLSMGYELDGAFWLRQAGMAKEANAIALQFAKDLPPRLRWQGAQRLYQYGFPQAARAAFDIVTEVKKTNANGQISPKVWRGQPAYVAEDAAFLSSFGWKSLAYYQASSNPELPAEWYGAIPSVQLKASVLASWIRAFAPEVPSQTPYGFSHHASAGGLQAGWS